MNYTIQVMACSSASMVGTPPQYLCEQCGRPQDWGLGNNRTYGPILIEVVGRRWQVCTSCAETLWIINALERATVPKEAQ